MRKIELFLWEEQGAETKCYMGFLSSVTPLFASIYLTRNSKKN